jgi:hypothetical protein
MSVSYKSTSDDKAALLVENTNWRAIVEQVVLLLNTRSDPDSAPVIIWLVRWLNDDKNLRRAANMSLEQIIEKGKREIHEKD